jgi:uncharacterized protein YegP (UPF0339 family)
MLRVGTFVVLGVLLVASVADRRAVAGSGPPVVVALVQAGQKEAKGAGRALKFETYSDAKGETRWRLKATNGQVIATSGQGYKDKRDARKAIDRIKGEAKTLKFETYADAKGETRWRLKASNGQIIATSGQGYKDKRDCENAITVIKEGVEKARIEGE